MDQRIADNRAMKKAIVVTAMVLIALSYALHALETLKASLGV